MFVVAAVVIRTKLREERHVCSKRLSTSPPSSVRSGMSLVHGVVTAVLTAFLFVPLLPELGTNDNSLLQTWRS